MNAVNWDILLMSHTVSQLLYSREVCDFRSSHSFILWLAAGPERDLFSERFSHIATVQYFQPHGVYFMF